MLLKFLVSTSLLSLSSCQFKDGNHNALNDPNSGSKERTLANEEPDSVGEKLFYFSDFKPTDKLKAIKDGLTFKTHSAADPREIPKITDTKKIEEFANISRIAGELEQFKENINKFQEAGGRIRLQAKTQESLVVIPINQSDLLIPICHEGMNRSQILYLALNNAPTGKYHVTKPHGAESGFDPHPKRYDNKLVEITEGNKHDYNYGVILEPKNAEGKWLDSEFIQEAFYSTFGVMKSKRIGQITAEQKQYIKDLNSEADTTDSRSATALARYNQRKEMDKLLYNADRLRKSTGTDGQVQFFLFVRANLIILSRLLEQTENKDFTGIVLNMYPWIDTLSRAKAGEESLRAHTEFYNLLNQTLSFESEAK